MPRISPVDWKTLVKVFTLHGCEYRRKEGSHHVLWCPGAKRAVVIPEYDEGGVGIIKNNMRTACLSRERYFDLLKQA